MNTSRRFARVLISLAAALSFAGVAAAATPTPSSLGSTPTPVAGAKHFVMVHGAWHGAWTWFKVEARLENAGHTVTTLDLPSHGTDDTDPATVTLADYTQAVVDVLDAASAPVILVGHSMGGVVLSSAAEARPAKVEKLVYLAAFLVPSGASMFDFAMQDTDSIVGQNLVIGAGTIDVAASAREAAFYGKSPAWAPALADDLLVVNPIAPIGTPLALTNANFGSVRRFYIKTTYDQAVTPKLQDLMIAGLPCEDVFTLKSDHSPFFSRPAQLTKPLLDIAAR